MAGDGSHTTYFQLRETFEKDRHGSLPDAYGFCSMAKSKSFELKKSQIKSLSKGSVFGSELSETVHVCLGGRGYGHSHLLLITC